MQRSQLCSICGNHHSGTCSYQITYFSWKPEIYQHPPLKVQIVGQWFKWQTYQEMVRQVDDDGSIYFQIRISIPVGRYEYKYIVDEVWRYSDDFPKIVDPYGSFNNYVEVLPKKALIEYIPTKDTKISSNLLLDNLKIIGSWDNWEKQRIMEQGFNNLKGCEQNFIYLELIPNNAYEFKFKHDRQYIIDEKFPTVPNQFGSLNNRIIVCGEGMSTPTGWRSSKVIGNNIPATCRSFEWNRVVVDPEYSMYKQTIQGHSICQVGEFIYIFGGRFWGDFTNTFTKVSIHNLSIMHHEQILPIQRAYHCAQTYGNKIIVYGGHNRQVLCDYNVFNTTGGFWIQPPEVHGKFPPKRQKQSCVLYEMLLVFFGGYYCSPDFQFETTFNDIQVLNIEQMKWIQQTSIRVSGPLPQPRFSHSATLVYSEMYIFGGTRNSNDHLKETKMNYNDLWVINLQRVSDLKWQLVQTKGKPPSPRHGHSCTNLQNYLIIFGGQGNELHFLNDVSVFNRQTKQWIHPIIKSTYPQAQPVGRVFHAATAINNEYIVIFGGKNKNPRTTSFYILKPVDLKPNLDIQEDSEEDLGSQANQKKSQQCINHSIEKLVLHNVQ